MDKKALYDLLGKYLNNSCTQDERKLIDHWLGLLQEDAAFASYTPADLDTIHHRIWQKIQAETYGREEAVIEAARPSLFIKMTRWAVAASLIGLVLFSGYRFLQPKALADKNEFALLIPKTGMITKSNSTSAPQKLMLEDSSLVILEPGAILNYPAVASTDKREAYLEGKALFEITKSSKRPFFIYHNNLVTHVLGTSFIINTKKQNNEAEVSVLTGRVEVSENRNLADNQPHKKINGVVLTPNQKVVYASDTRVFVPSIADNPLPLRKKSAEGFDFNEVALTKVLLAISSEYAIEIVTENEAISKCTFTGSIARQGLYEKLDIICQATNSTYELKGTKVLIKGPGCE